MLQDFSIRARLTIWYLLSVTVIVAIMSIVSWWAMRASMYSVIDDNLDRRIKNVASSIRETNVASNIRETDVSDLRAHLGELAKTTSGGGFYQVFTAEGALVYQSEGLASRGVTAAAPDVHSGAMAIRNSGYSTSQVRLGSRLVEVNGRAWIVEWGEPLNLVNSSLERFLRFLFLSAPLLIGLGVIAAYGISGRALAPVDWIIRDARSINTGNLGERLSVPKAHDELRRLSETLNAMLDRIEATMRQIRQFTGDASHELRSPITLIRTAAEYALEGDQPREELIDALNRIEHESRHTTQLINDLLLLTRTDAQADLRKQVPVDLSAAVLDVFDRIAPLAAAKQLTMRSDVSANPVCVSGDTDLLERLVFILLDNAVKYTPPEGDVRITVADKGGAAAIEVADTGIGIAKEDLSHIFDRFWRADKVRSRQMGGSGLGLSIAQKIVEQSGGSISVESEMGRGSKFIVTLPLLDAVNQPVSHGSA